MKIQSRLDGKIAKLAGLSVDRRRIAEQFQKQSDNSLHTHTHSHSGSQLKSRTHIHTHKQNTRTYATTIKSMTAWHFCHGILTTCVCSKCRYLIVFIAFAAGTTTTPL